MNNKLKELHSSDIFSHLASASYLPRWCVLLIDVFLCSVAYWISILIGNGIFSYGFVCGGVLPFWTQFAILMIVQVICFWLFHSYSGILRYSTFIDTIKSLLAVLSCGGSVLIFNLIYTQITGSKVFLNTALVIYTPIAFILLFSLRVGVKTLYEFIKQHAPGTKKVLIWGTKSAGIAIAKMLRSASGEESPYRPVGFLGDNDSDERNHSLVGLRVFPFNQQTLRWMSEHHVRDVIISPLKMRSIKPSTDLQIFFDNDIHVLTTPQFTQFENAEEIDNQRIGRIESIQIEDLLERPAIHINTDNVLQIIHNQVVLVSGAAGSIGSELVRQVQKYQPQLTVLLEQAESPLHDLYLDLKTQFPDAHFVPVIADIRNRERIEEVFNEFNPAVVYHAAAYKHVPLMESHPNEAVRANVMGTKNMADMAVKYGVKRFVMISTDKAVNPTNIMGASKRIAEIYVQSLFKALVKENPNCTKFITTRFGNVLGSNGSVIPYFKKQIAEGGPVTVTHPDIIRYFMTIPEACTLVMEAATLGNGGEIFVFDMGHPVKILDLAKNMIRLAGYVPCEEIPIVFTGLRPGEKLYEELLNQKETTLPTSNDKIMVARVREFDFEQIEKSINALIDLTSQNKPFLTVQQMKAIVPEFISNNSIFEKLDK